MTIQYTEVEPAPEFNFLGISEKTLEQMKKDQQMDPYFGLAAFALSIIFGILTYAINGGFAVIAIPAAVVGAVILSVWHDTKLEGGKTYYAHPFWALISCADYLKFTHDAEFSGRRPPGQNVLYVSAREYTIPLVARQMAAGETNIIALVQLRTKVLSGTETLEVLGPLRYRAL